MDIRLLPYRVADGPHNMAADESLLLAAASGTASVRFYGWPEATLSLGYFQPFRTRSLPSLPWIRRPTGGATLVHHRELTYALALPASLAPSCPVWMRRMHEIVVAALAELLPVHLETAPRTLGRTDDALCFHQHTVGDVICSGHKIMGSAQRKQRQCLLQHGALLLAQSSFTPSLPGLKELAGFEPAIDDLIAAICAAFRRSTGWDIRSHDWSDSDRDLIETLVAEKYGKRAWNEKR